MRNKEKIPPFIKLLFYLDKHSNKNFIYSRYIPTAILFQTIIETDLQIKYIQYYRKFIKTYYKVNIVGKFKFTKFVFAIFFLFFFFMQDVTPR